MPRPARCSSRSSRRTSLTWGWLQHQRPGTTYYMQPSHYYLPQPNTFFTWPNLAAFRNVMKTNQYPPFSRTPAAAAAALLRSSVPPSTAQQNHHRHHSHNHHHHRDYSKTLGRRRRESPMATLPPPVPSTSQSLVYVVEAGSSQISIVDTVGK